MQGTLALGSLSGLTSSASISFQPDGLSKTSSLSLWPSKNQIPVNRSRLNGRGFSDRSGTGRGGKWKILAAKSETTTQGRSKPIAPLQPESPSGQFLTEILQSHPHLFSAAAEQQLESLAEAREAANGQEKPSTVGTELVLYKRIAELRAQEMRRTLEDIMYALISQRFIEAGISFVPSMSPVSRDHTVDDWPAQDRELEAVHSHEAFELIQEHLTLVLGGREPDTLDQTAMAQISKLRMGQVYAASVIYGYFLRRVDKRFQLEKTMKVLPTGLVEVEPVECKDGQENDLTADVVPAVTSLALRDVKQVPQSSGRGRRAQKGGRLRSYVMSFDSDTLQRYATVRSKESASVIERHTEALFGKPEIQIIENGSIAIAKDEVIMLSFLGLRRLVLEAVAFGSFLWDVETYVDTHYHIVAH